MVQYGGSSGGGGGDMVDALIDRLRAQSAYQYKYCIHTLKYCSEVA